jgi:hypothetical protein
MGRLMISPKTPAPRKFQKFTPSRKRKAPPWAKVLLA